MIFLINKIHAKTFREMRNERVFRSKTKDYEELKAALQEKATEEWSDKLISSQKGGRQLLALDEMNLDEKRHQPKMKLPTKSQNAGAKGRVKGRVNLRLHLSKISPKMMCKTNFRHPSPASIATKEGIMTQTVGSNFLKRAHGIIIEVGVVV